MLAGNSSGYSLMPTRYSLYSPPRSAAVAELAQFALRALLLIAVAFLDATDKFFSLAGNLVQIIIREFAPLLFDFAFELLPVPLHLIPVHLRSLSGPRSGRPAIPEMCNRCAGDCVVCIPAQA